jgi:uncharacterized membrane protein YbhN (UPF0104 family)
MKLKRTLVLSFGAGVLVMLVVAMFADFGETFGALRHMHLRWLPLLFLLSLANYVSRFARWEYFLRMLGLRIPLRDSMDVFLGGFVFSVTPGKLGELFKSVLLKETHGIAIARTAPVVFAERFSDLGGLLILASLGVYGSRQGGIYWLVGMAMLVALFALLSSKRLGDLLIALIGRIGPLARRTGAAAKVRDASISRAFSIASLTRGRSSSSFALLLSAKAASFFRRPSSLRSLSLRISGFARKRSSIAFRAISPITLS